MSVYGIKTERDDTREDDLSDPVDTPVVHDHKEDGQKTGIVDRTIFRIILEQDKHQVTHPQEYRITKKDMDLGREIRFFPVGDHHHQQIQDINNDTLYKPISLKTQSFPDHKQGIEKPGDVKQQR